MKENNLKTENTDELRVPGIRSKGYGVLPKLIMCSPSLSLEAKAVYSFFCSFAGSGNSAFPGRDYILHFLNINKQTYYNALNELKAFRLITVKQKKNENRQYSKNVYTLQNDVTKIKDSFFCKEEKALDLLTTEGVLKDGFGFISKLVMTDEELSYKVKALYAYLCVFAGAGPTCYPKKEDLTLHLDINKQTYTKYLKQLILKNYITQTQLNNNGKFGRNIYTIVENPSTLPHIKLQDTAPQDTATLPHIKLQDTAPQDTNINSLTINKKNLSISSDKERLIELSFDEIEDILTENLCIPNSWLGNRKYISTAIKILNNYSEREREETWNNKLKCKVFKLYIKALIDMLSTQKTMNLTGDKVICDEVNEFYTNFIENGEFEAIDTLSDTAMSCFIEGCKKTAVKNELGYMKACIWNCLKTGNDCLAACINVGYTEENELSEVKELSTKELILRKIPNMKDLILFFGEDYEDYKRSGSRRVFQTEKEIKKLLKENGFDENLIYKELMKGYSLK